MASSWPQDWASRGDAHTTVSSDPRKALSLSFRCYIEGREYDRPTQYITVEVPGEFRDTMQSYDDDGYSTPGGIKAVAKPEVMKQLGYEWLAISTHTGGYPSGGSAEYASYAYFDGERLYTGGDTRVKWNEAIFYQIGR